MKAIAVQKEAAYNPEELNKTFQLASEDSTAASIPGDVDSFKASVASEEVEAPLEDVPHVASIVDLAKQEG